MRRAMGFPSLLGGGAAECQERIRKSAPPVAIGLRPKGRGGGEDTKGREEKEKQREDERDNERKKRIKIMGKLR